MFGGKQSMMGYEYHVNLEESYSPMYSPSIHVWARDNGINNMRSAGL